MAKSSNSLAVKAPSQDQRDDEVLFDAYKAGDQNAFRILVERHNAPVYRFCLRSLGSPEAAADATQEVFLRVVKYAPSWEKRAKFTTWMYTIARNFCIDASRKARFRKTQSLNEKLGGEEGIERLERVASPDPAADSLTEAKRLRATIDEALAELPEEQRDVFCLRQYSGLAFKEIAEATNVSENTVKSRMRYALSAVRKVLISKGFERPDTS